MANIEIIKELRNLSNLSYREVQQALEEAGGDKERAIDILKARGAALAEKKASRATQEGVVNAYVHATKKIGAMVELLCETDFVARNPMFTELAHDLAMHIAAMNPKDVEELLEQPYIKDQDLTIRDFIAGYIAKLGENIRVGQFIRFQL